MKPPDDIASRLARLRVEIVEAFMAGLESGDLKAWQTANAEMREILGTAARTAARREARGERGRINSRKRWSKHHEQQD